MSFASRLSIPALSALAFVLAAIGDPTAPLFAQEKPPEKAAARPRDEPAGGPAKPGTVAVEQGPFRVEVSLPGVFEATKLVEVSVKPKAWTMPLAVESALELGSPVKKGDLLVEFDRSKIDKAIQDAEVELKLGELALKQAMEELPVLEKNLPIDLAAAERSRAQADEDLARFLEIDRPNAEKQAEFSLKSATEYLAYAREELRQLEKMYRSKDLTEETEEIILRRNRFQVESSEFRLKEAELARDATLKVELPRREIKARENAARQALELQKARAVLPLAVNQKRLALAKLEHDHARAREKLADLGHDRDAMTVHAAADGLVYYGRHDGGAWPQAASMASRLRKGGVIQADEVFITVVSPRPLVVRASVDEKDLRHLSGRDELKGRAVPAADPGLSLPARLSRVVPVPREAGKFGVVAEVDLDPAAALVRPGMACTLRFTPYRAASALTLPASAVFEEESGDGSVEHVVYLTTGEEKPHRHVVKVGRTSGGRTEILGGLKAGDRVLSSKP
ncbi:MAG: hypothetical protein U0790_29135 [Isosphaeraceae bacterium]